MEFYFLERENVQYLLTKTLRYTFVNPIRCKVLIHVGILGILISRVDLMLRIWCHMVTKFES